MIKTIANTLAGVVFFACALAPSALANTVQQVKELSVQGALTIADLEDRGFIIQTANSSGYHPIALAQSSAEQIEATLQALSADGSAGPAVLFYLTIAGATLDDPQEWQSFISRQLIQSDSLRRDMLNMHNFLKRAPDQPEVWRALINYTHVIKKQREVEIAYQFLEDIGFIDVEMHNPQGASGDVDDMSFKRSTLTAANGQSALPQAAAENLAATLKKGKPMARRAGTHLMFHQGKLGVSQ